MVRGRVGLCLGLGLGLGLGLVLTLGNHTEPLLTPHILEKHVVAPGPAVTICKQNMC